MEILLQVTNKCNLNCKFCAYNFLGKQPLELIDYDRFVNICSKLLDYGFDKIQLTPTIGEPLLDPTLIDKIELLEADPRVKRITFFTNFVKVSEDFVKRLMKTRKTVMFISVYGWDDSSFESITNKDLFYSEI